MKQDEFNDLGKKWGFECEAHNYKGENRRAKPPNFFYSDDTASWAKYLGSSNT